MKRGVLLDVIVGEPAHLFQLLAGIEQSLPIRWYTNFLLNLRLHVVNGIGSHNCEGNRLACQRLHEDLHVASGLRHGGPML